ncbi:hypothetical protein [Rhodococcus koreensis]|uniref:hypothetical protein n=1 Tax=Rhodococcus koreensis TaxID=99653 RepID=UPI00366F0A75
MSRTAAPSFDPDAVPHLLAADGDGDGDGDCRKRIRAGRSGGHAIVMPLDPLPAPELVARDYANHWARGRRRAQWEAGKIR